MKLKLSKKRVAFNKLDAEIASCSKCPGLNKPEDTMSASGYGVINSPIMFVGQSLHAYNNETPDRQIPFVGPSTRYDSGNILIEAIEETGFTFSDVFTTNAVHCHPPKNRASREGEVGRCSEYLEREIKLVRPRVIIALGTSAVYALGRLGITIPHERAKIYRKRLRICRKLVGVCWVYHPAYLLRRGIQEETDQWKRVVGKIIRTAFQLSEKSEPNS